MTDYIKNNINFKMSTRELGGRVLSTIQNLISQIDKSAQLSNTRKIAYKKSFDSFAEEEFCQNKVYQKMSYSFRKRQMRTNDILKNEVYKEQRQPEKFKITNKTTLKIINSKSIKPIHQRTREILAKRNNFIKHQQLHIQQKEKQAMRPLHHSIDDIIYRKYNQSELEEYRMEIDAKNKERIKKKNMSKLPLVKKQDIKIPAVNQVSRSLSSQRNLRKNYSGNVFKRLMQYNYEQKSRQIELMEARRRQEGNFEPVICQKSIEIAQNLQKKEKRSEHSLHHHSDCQFKKASQAKQQTKTAKKRKVNRSVSKEVTQTKSVQKSLNKSHRVDIKKQEKLIHKISKKCKSRTPLTEKSQSSINIKEKSQEKKQKQPKQQRKTTDIKRKITSKTNYL